MLRREMEGGIYRVESGKVVVGRKLGRKVS